MHDIFNSPALTLSIALAAGMTALALGAVLRVPGILLALGAGVLLGPSGPLKVVRPETLGPWLQIVVGFCVSVILFEGALSLNPRRLKRTGTPVRRLISIGALIAAGGAALVALKDTKHPEEVGKLMDYLSSADVLAEFYGKTLFIPGHLGLAAGGVDFATDDPRAKHALETFAGAVPTISPIAFNLQGYANNRVMFNALISRLGEAIVGELTLDQAFERMTQDVEQQLAEKARN